MARIFVTGGTGFVGQEILRELHRQGYGLRCLVRPGSEGKLPLREGVEIIHGDLREPASLENAATGCEAVIHLVGIIREYPRQGITFKNLHVEATRQALKIARTARVSRYLHMSALGVREGAVSAYHRTKWEAEEIVRASGLTFTIFRPSVIVGPEGEFMTMISRLVRCAPVVPVIGDGRYRLQPVALETVARGFVTALRSPAAKDKTFEVAGPDPVTYNEFLDLVGKCLGKKVRRLHQPLWLMRPLVAALEKVPFFPLTSNQLTMLLEDNTTDPDPFYRTLGLEPIPVEDAIRRALR
ncbi:MAG: complex I NDUFA9 subunit family protein [Candidatus Tectomicrobia bacterium]|uniref:Complex I NDUFA9 subunit family protein n=1 Tax=Tectimicrobiota bacterium TaxID=2528274 RepID=A0A932M1R0_UNCTE|nr:complex I NDUFA9 subunit family protein [Candidatus Tectomicrobia bacterium]